MLLYMMFWANSAIEGRLSVALEESKEERYRRSRVDILLAGMNS